MAPLWISLTLLAVDLIGLALLARKRGPGDLVRAPRGFWLALRWRWAAIALGACASVGTCLIRYRYNDKYFALGFPLPGAVFEISTGSDFVGPLTLPFLFLDALLLATLPLAILTIGVALRKRARAG